MSDLDFMLPQELLISKILTAELEITASNNTDVSTIINEE
jgi:hypothetical protein